VTDAARARLASVARIGTVVRIETAANIAIGQAPWGPFAAAAAASGADAAWLDAARTITVSADVPLPDPAALEGGVLVVGKDLHRHPFAVATVDALRAVRGDVVTVDMGWPSDDRAYADIATFGASRLVGEALLGFVGHAVALATTTTP
jgi:beta-N-acetylhexosaminidase